MALIRSFSYPPAPGPSGAGCKASAGEMRWGWAAANELGIVNARVEGAGIGGAVPCLKESKSVWVSLGNATTTHS